MISRQQPSLSKE